MNIWKGQKNICECCMKELLEKKGFKVAVKISKIFVTVVLIGFVIVVCLQRFTNNKVSFFNYRMFSVISGSMEPKYKIGDILLAKEVEPSSIKVGDVISYMGEKGDLRGKVITHQVTRVNKSSDGSYLFHAKGLTNIIEDPIIKENQLYGVVIYKSFLLSIIYKIVATNIGFYLFIIIPLIFIIGSEIIITLLNKEEERRKKVNN